MIDLKKRMIIKSKRPDVGICLIEVDEFFMGFLVEFWNAATSFYEHFSKSNTQKIAKLS